MKKIAFVFLFATLLAVRVKAQVGIAPPVVYIGNSVPFGTLAVTNSTNVPQQVEISFRFGFPASDSLGKMYIDFNDSLAAEKYSCASWVSGFPTKFILNPGQEQVVHMTISPPDTLPDGAYWSRIITVSQPQQTFNTAVQSGVRANVIFVFKQITALMYENGKVGTKLTFDGLRESQDSSSVNIYAGLRRGGNAPFLGTASIRVVDDQGQVVYTDFGLVAVYLSFVQHFAVPISKLPPGKYKAEIEVTSERPDIPPQHLLQISPISKSIRFIVK